MAVESAARTQEAARKFKCQWLESRVGRRRNSSNHGDERAPLRWPSSAARSPVDGNNNKWSGRPTAARSHSTGRFNGPDSSATAGQ